MNRKLLSGLLAAALFTSIFLPACTSPRLARHTTTEWKVEPNMAYDALCFIPALTGDPFYLTYYQIEYNRFKPKLTADVQQALENLRTVVKAHDSLLSTTLVQLFQPLTPKTIDDLLRAIENPESIRSGANLSADDPTWQLIASHLPELKTILNWMNDAGFQQDYETYILPGITETANALSQQLPDYNILPDVEAALGEKLASEQITIYLAYYVLPFGIGMATNQFIFYSKLTLSTIVDNSIHEDLHIIDIQEKNLWEALSVLKDDPFYMHNFQIHDPSNGYMLFEQFVEEDVVEALDQYLAEQFHAAENAQSRWRSVPRGLHPLSPVLYVLLKQEKYSPERETYHDFLIRMVREGKLKAGMIENARSQFFAEP